MQGYYIQLFSPHGLIRYQHPEIGKDKDTGGQVKYVLELVEALSRHPQVRKVDLFTRRIDDKKVSPLYREETEVVNDKARIVRISCGGSSYREKEQLWDYLDEFVDNTIRFIEKQDDFPDITHGHYADGNYIAGEISKIFGTPFISTGHSLGRNKLKVLLAQGLDEESVEKKFNIHRRISEEEKTLARADLIIVSTAYEIESQYQSYENKDKARFRVISPGINADIFYPFYRQGMPGFSMPIQQEHALYRINSEIERFLFAPDKPLILSIGRADKRKNFETIIDCYGQDKQLQAMANLAIFAGVRKDISQMPPDEQETLTNLLLLMDKYDLYGKMAIPKKNEPTYEVPEIYRVAAHKKGVFVNATPGENFGLTIVEAAASGLPVIASPDGGPKEILERGNNGLLVDVSDVKAIAEALKKIISDNSLWDQFSTNGIKAGQENYSWEHHAEKYINAVDEIFSAKTKSASSTETSFGKRLVKAGLFFISDLDGTLIDGEKQDGLAELKKWIEDHRDKVVFGIASGRNRYLLREAFQKFSLPEPDILICSVGTEIYYTGDFIPDNGWKRYINYQWKREELQELLDKMPKLRLQDNDAQWIFKLSYYVSDDFSEEDLTVIYKLLNNKKLKARITLTENKFLDVLPFRAGKGNAIRYLGKKWKLPLGQFITAGNSGNDIDLLTGKMKGIVVANHSPEMEVLKKRKNIFFSRSPLSAGVLEGIKFYAKKFN